MSIIKLSIIIILTFGVISCINDSDSSTTSVQSFSAAENIGQSSEEAIPDQFIPKNVEIIPFNTPHQITLGTIDDTIFYTIELPYSGRVSIDLSSPLDEWTAYTYVLDSNNTEFKQRYLSKTYDYFINTHFSSGTFPIGFSARKESNKGTELTILVTADSVRYNKYPETAATITLDQTVTGVFNDFSGDTLYYNVTVPKNGFIDKNVVLPDADPYLVAYRAIEISPEADVQSNWFLDSGDYRISVHRNNYNDSREAVPFQFSLSLDTLDQHEPNNDFFSATPLPFGKEMQGIIREEDSDYFQFSTSKPQLVSLTATSGSSHMYAAIYTTLRTKCGMGFDDTTRTKTVICDLDEAGRYGVSFETSEAERVTDPYDFSFIVEEYTADTLEYHPLFPAGYPLEFGREFESYLYSAEDWDRYKIHTSIPGSVNAHFHHPDSFGVRLRLYDSQEEYVDMAIKTDSNIVLPDTGTYYLQIVEGAPWGKRVDFKKPYLFSVDFIPTE